MSTRPATCIGITSFVGAGLAIAALGACNSGFPSSYQILLPNGNQVATAILSGPALLANSRWAFYDKNTEELITRVEFDSTGRIARFFDTNFESDALGTEFLPDNMLHPSMAAGINYLAVTYGASVDTGFGAVALGQVSLGPFVIATMSIAANGTLTGQELMGSLALEFRSSGPTASSFSWDGFAQRSREFVGRREG